MPSPAELKQSDNLFIHPWDDIDKLGRNERTVLSRGEGVLARRPQVGDLDHPPDVDGGDDRSRQPHDPRRPPGVKNVQAVGFVFGIEGGHHGIGRRLNGAPAEAG